MSSPSSSPTPQKVNVRNIISIFENQSTYEPSAPVRRAKSMQNLSFTPSSRKPAEYIELEHNFELAQIEQQVRHLHNNISTKYKTYSRDSHIYYQNQIIFILTDIANINSINDPRTAEHKSDLTEALKKLSKKLNTLLPSGGAINFVPKVDTVKVQRSRSEVDGRKAEVIVNKIEPIVRKREEVEEKRVVEEEPPVSVRNLKEMFEKNTTENEGKAEFGVTKISRKFTTFNGVSDFKYLTYSERFKSTLDSEFVRPAVKKQFLTVDIVDGVAVSDDKMAESVSDFFTNDSLSDGASDSEELETAPELEELEVD